MTEIYKEALSHIWLMLGPNMIELAKNHTVSCSDSTTKTPNECALNQSNTDHSLFRTSTDGASLEILLGLGADCLGLIAANLLYILNKIRLLFYLVWPSETMFSSLNQVPRYVAEVST